MKTKKFEVRENHKAPWAFIRMKILAKRHKAYFTGVFYAHLDGLTRPIRVTVGQNTNIENLLRDVYYSVKSNGYDVGPHPRQRATVKMLNRAGVKPSTIIVPANKEVSVPMTLWGLDLEVPGLRSTGSVIYAGRSAALQDRQFSR